MNIEVKDVNKVIAKYDELLSLANKHVVMLSVMNQEANEEIKNLKKQLEEKEHLEHLRQLEQVEEQEEEIIEEIIEIR